MNPARSFGPALVGGLWQTHWLYWLAPVTGMLAAARVYDLLRHAEPPLAQPEVRPLGIQGPIATAPNGRTEVSERAHTRDMRAATTDKR